MNKLNFSFFRRHIFAAIFLSTLCAGVSRAQGDAPVRKSTQELILGDTRARIVLYERKGADITFFSPHHNEQIALEAAREAVAKHGGRLVAIESLDERGRPARRLRFSSRGKAYSLDPNRIFTANGRRCAGFPPADDAGVANFAEGLLKILFAADGARLGEGERIIVAVHNNADVSGRSPADRATDLTAVAFARAGREQPSAPGAFHEQAAGVYLSNLEDDEDDFVLLSTPRFLSFFAERGFNVVVQKPAALLRGSGCEIDDGSLSVYSSLRNIPYINLEADAQSGGLRQRQMLEAVFQLLPTLSAKDAGTTQAPFAK